MVRLFSVKFTENKILPPYFMKIALISARIKGLKTYWGGVYIGLFEGFFTPNTAMKRTARNFGVAGLPVNGKYQAAEKLGIVWLILH